LKALLIEQGMWSQYLEVGIGPYAEVFTKCQALSAVGFGEDIGINAISEWNNPEPEVVLMVNPDGAIVGATLGNDVNLRDIEGRSALLLGKAKDNNASCAIGPFIRLLDETFTLQQLREQEVELQISGDDGYVLQDRSSMTQISRDICDLVSQTINESHQYPDGLALFTGTLFTPSEDRDEPGKGFTHHLGDRVRIRSSHLGCLENRVTHSHLAPPWTFGLSQLMRNLHRRGLLR
jgi:fumarylacetoacetate (FAA) hydrolase family protein